MDGSVKQTGTEQHAVDTANTELAAPEPDIKRPAKTSPEVKSSAGNATSAIEASPSLGPTGGPVPIRRVGRRRAAGPSRAAAAANDDVPSIGGLIYALQQKPSRRPFTVAAIMSGIWLLVGTILVWFTYSSDDLLSTPMSELLTRPQTVLLASAVMLPIVLFWFLALLFWRSQELRLMSSAMTEVAVRLAEPDRLAEQSVASLGQTVRRQVMSMNDAINRALGRAGELEALVHNEVAALERAYNENEVRVRGLIKELASERQSLTNNSNRVNDSIRGIGLEITKEIAAASDAAAQSLSNATTTLTTEVHKSGSQLTARIQATNDQTAHLMSESGNSLLASLGEMNKRIGVEVPALLDKMSGEQTRLPKVVEGAGRNLAALETALGERVESLDTSLGEKTGQLRDVLQHKIKDFDDTFSDKARALDTAIGEKMGQFDNSIAIKAKVFYQALEKAGSKLDGTILDRTRAIEAGMQRQAGLVDSTIAKGIQAVRQSSENITTQSLRTLDGLSQHGDSLRDVSEVLLSQIQNLTDRFDKQGQSITRAAQDLEVSSLRIDSVLETRQNEMSALLDQVSAQAETLEGTARGQGSLKPGGANLRDRYVQASREITQSVRQTGRPDPVQADRRGEIEHMRAQLGRELDRLPRNDSNTSDGALYEQTRSVDALSDFSGDQAPRGEPQPLRRLSDSAAARPAITHQDRSAPPQNSRSPSVGRGEQMVPSGERWSLGDLLSRASGELPPPAATEPAAGYSGHDSNDVALDLKSMAQAIDMQTATNVWSRLNAGEQNTLNRSIYTHDGQATFDEIGRRYSSTAAFRNTVNRYLADFERLLREVDQKDPGGGVVRNHLVSEMGRVYLLLAHASGRLA